MEFDGDGGGEFQSGLSCIAEGMGNTTTEARREKYNFIKSIPR